MLLVSPYHFQFYCFAQTCICFCFQESGINISRPSMAGNLTQTPFWSLPGQSATPLHSPPVTAGSSATPITGKQFRCPSCPKMFHCRNSVTRHHHRAHDGRYTHTCTQCGKGFMNWLHYRGHMAKHTSRREYRCSWCSAEYAYKWHLKSHIASHHPEQRWSDDPGQSPRSRQGGSGSPGLLYPVPPDRADCVQLQQS